MSHWKSLGKSLLIGASASVITALNFGSAFAANYAITDQPLFLRDQPPPLNMLVMSRDHRMYYEAYNDASDLDGDDLIDNNYIASKDFKYYGYFSSERCYVYSTGSGRFQPVSKTSDKTCAGGKAGGQWSGDWLNYITTSRIDALRKVLYGGLRSTDTDTLTVLQRAFIPQDAHSWGKSYKDFATNHYYINQFAPFDMPTGGNKHLFANTTPSASGLVTGEANPALNNIGLPLMRVLENRNNEIWDWLSSERLVADTDIHSGASQGGVTPADYVVRVEVCSSSAKDDDNCKTYPSGNAKPTGLLQEYGESDKQLFGLLTGSYGRPHDGGVLRKPVGSLKDEIDAATGKIKMLGTPGIINTIDRLRITGFNKDVYACGWIADSSDADGNCSMWGNPTAEMMYETLRYFAGKGSPTTAFSDKPGNLEEADLKIGQVGWGQDPFKKYPYCSKPYETVISDINPSYDSDKIPGSKFGGSADNFTVPMDANDIGQTIWSKESGWDKLLKDAGGRFFIGESGGNHDQAPTVKDVSSFGDIRGLAPEGPTKQGSYMAGSVAYYGRINDISDAKREQNVRTFAVALASPLPRIDIEVGGGRVTLVPFAKSVGGFGINPAEGNYQPTNQIVDFYVQDISSTEGSFRVNFEDVEQGADHDMDAIALYHYKVNGSKLEVTVTSEYAAGSIIQHMGYVISGTTADGTYLEVRDVDTDAASDPDYFLDTPDNEKPKGNWKDNKALPAGVLNPHTRMFDAGSTTGAGFLRDPLYYAAKWGGFKETKNVGDGNKFPNLEEEWASKKVGKPDNYLPDNYFLVTSAIHLKDQLSAAFDDINEDAGSASSAAVSSGSISDDTHVYQAEFLAQDWSGHLWAYPISDGDTNNNNVKNEALIDIEEGVITTTGAWDAAAILAKKSPDDRRLVTASSVPGSGMSGTYTSAVPLRWDDLTPAMQVELRTSAELEADAKLRLDYLRGDQSKELPLKNGFRKRSSLLGDIVNSGPTFVGAPRARIRDSLESGPYSKFRSDNQSRQSMLYVGANDGMLHAFDATTGDEVFSYIPRSVFPDLIDFSSSAYTHRFYVDGTPSVGDAFFGGDWHTMLVGGLNKGGQGMFALDITNPGVKTEAEAAKLLKWEFTDAEDKDLGYTYARPTIARLRDGKWYAIFGNGYNNTDDRSGKDTHVSTSGEAVLYIVDVATGVLKWKLGTGVGMSTANLPTTSYPNGLSTPAVADLNGDAIADYVFAGDLYGNMWKFDLTTLTPKVGNGGSPIFTATNALGKVQPITVKPSVDIGPKGIGMIVLFGTGKFLEPSDRDVSQATVQSFYGIYDANPSTGTVTVDRTQLTQQKVIGETTLTIDGVPASARATTNEAVPSGNKGWYIDLLAPGTPPVFQGEMAVTDPLLRNGRVLFTTLIPDQDPCNYGGRSWLMEMDEMSGARLAYSPFDFNNDKSFNSTDYISVPNGSGGSDLIPATGFSRDAIMSRPAVIAGQYGDYAIMTDTSGGGLGVKPPSENDGVPDQKPTRLNPGPGAIGRQSWRQLR